jgi:hypothetical protein
VTSFNGTTAINAAQAHGWIGTETVRTRLGDFEFRGGYPTDDSAARLADQRAYSRAVDAYLAQMPVVSMYNVWQGVAHAGRGVPNQVVLWETSVDARTVWLTGNSETVFALCALDLERDGPAVIEAPLGVLGGVTDLWQRLVLNIGPRGADSGHGGRFLVVPPSYSHELPEGYFVTRSPTYRAVMGLRGFPVGGQRERAVAVLRQVKVYPLAAAGHPSATTFVNASEEPLDMVFSDTEQFFADLAQVIQREPAERLSPIERFQLASIGIEKGRPFSPDAERQALLRDAARFGAATARASYFSSNDPSRLVYSDRRWEWAFNDARPVMDSTGQLDIDHRAALAYVTSGVSPALVEHAVGQSSQYVWTPRDSNGAYLDGGKEYLLRLPPGIPVRLFWSLVVYDAVSRSMLENGGTATISQYSGCNVNDDGSVEVCFGPQLPWGHAGNWVKTVAGRGWFPLLRLCGPLPSFFNRSWKPDDIIELQYARPALTPLGPTDREPRSN